MIQALERTKKKNQTPTKKTTKKKTQPQTKQNRNPVAQKWVWHAKLGHMDTYNFAPLSLHH